MKLQILNVMKMEIHLDVYKRQMLSLANKALLMNTWWVIVIPGLFLVVTLSCITNIGNYLRKEINRGDNNL